VWGLYLFLFLTNHQIKTMLLCLLCITIPGRGCLDVLCRAKYEPAFAEERELMAEVEKKLSVS